MNDVPAYLGPTKTLVEKFKKLTFFLSGAARLADSPWDAITIGYLLFRWRLVDNMGGLRFLLPRVRRVRVRFHNRSFDLTAPDDLSFAHVFFEVFLCEVYRPEPDLAPRVILDVGAQFGLASVYFAVLFPDARIYSFEPTSFSFAFMKKNTAAFQNVFPFFLGLFSAAGHQKIFLNKRRGENSMLGEGGQHEEIQTETLDGFLTTHNIARVDLMKIDVEGAEEAILGASRRLDDIGYIMGELHYGVIDRTAFETLLGRYFDYVIENEEAACATFKGRNRSRLESGIRP